MKKTFPYYLTGAVVWLVLMAACNSGNGKPELLYTCPMPQDSVFSDKPGKCPKCGMELVRIKDLQQDDDMDMGRNSAQYGYACPMHPTVQSDTAGSCPVCGMPLEKIKPADQAGVVSLNTLLEPVNRQVVAAVPMVHKQEREENIEMEAYGFIMYDTRRTGAIAANISGRIEKLYVQYRYQHISRGQKILDIYSPELLTAQQNLLFVLKNDPENQALISAARQKLLLLGMSARQLEKVIRTKEPAYTVSLYSNYTGHIHESVPSAPMQESSNAGMNAVSRTTEALMLKEGAYLEKGQTIFSVYDPRKAWAVLNIFAGQATMVKKGDKVRIIPETSPGKDFRASISYVEPFYRQGSKTLTARVYFDNAAMKIPVGSQVKAIVFAGNRNAWWLPEEAVLSLGLDKVVFVRSGESFKARKIETGIVNKHLIQVLSGLDKAEAVAANAQYLVDSESFIKTSQ